MAKLSYFEQITACLNKHDLLRSLEKQRNELIKGINVIAKKMNRLEDECFERKHQIENQLQDLDLPVEILDEVIVSQEQINFLSKLSQNDDYLSELYSEYENELIAVEEEIIELKNKTLSIAA